MISMKIKIEQIYRFWLIKAYSAHCFPNFHFIVIWMNTIKSISISHLFYMNRELIRSCLAGCIDISVYITTKLLKITWHALKKIKPTEWAWFFRWGKGRPFLDHFCPLPLNLFNTIAKKQKQRPREFCKRSRPFHYSTETSKTYHNNQRRVWHAGTCFWIFPSITKGRQEYSITKLILKLQHKITWVSLPNWSENEQQQTQ